jgi:hypothetical protein
MRVFHAYQNTTNGAGVKLESSNSKMIASAGNALNYLGSIGSTPLLFVINSIERARIDSSGNLTIRNAGYLGVESPGTNRVGKLYTSSNATVLESHNGFGEPLFLISPTGYISLSTDGSERARIDSSGNLLVGATSGESIIFRRNTDTARATTRVISACATTGNQFGISVELDGDPNNADQYIFAGRGGVNGSTDRCIIRSNGGIANYQGNNVNLSDRREKINFSPAKSYLETICAIPVQTFNYTDQNNEDDPGLTLGVVAQDVQAVAPELVMESNWGTEEEPKMRLSIYQTDLQYALMKCIQEQQALITALTARVAALESN